ncbi:NRDE family protein [Moraxella canis]|uniref:NRDE family protein n=1 Tax=Moraxella canis TaxID=90239 RepID=UPI00066588A7|nr:NRDE family protein [Moraxella canis]
MCIAALAWQTLPDTPLLLISNRDEFYERPTLPLHACDGIIAGRDKQAGGTWMGVTLSGRWAILTNFRDGQDKRQYATSRGTLVQTYLDSYMPPLRFLEDLKSSQTDFAGFNLIVGDRTQAAYMSNKGVAPTVLAPGVYTLSNGLISDEWFKCARLRMRFCQEILPLFSEKPGFDNLIITPELSQAVWQVLEDTQKAEDDQLPNTGVDLHLERLLSSIFIQSSNYGTRVSNLLCLQNHHLSWQEKQQQGEQMGQIFSWFGHLKHK